MPKYRTKPDVERSVDIATGDQVIGTPWGQHPIRAGDMMVPYGTRTVPVPGNLWREWFDDAEPVAPVPEPEPEPVEDKDLSELTRAELHTYARRRFGADLNDRQRKSELVKEVRKLQAESGT